MTPRRTLTSSSYWFVTRCHYMTGDDLSTFVGRPKGCSQRATILSTTSVYLFSSNMYVYRAMNNCSISRKWGPLIARRCVGLESLECRSRLSFDVPFASRLVSLRTQNLSQSHIAMAVEYSRLRVTRARN